MPDPFTPAFIAANCVWGALKGLSGQAAGAAAKRLAQAFRERQAPANHEVLAATHAAFIRSIQFMADACDKSGGEARDQFSAMALSKLSRDASFTTFRFDGDILPEKELDSCIRAISKGAENGRAIKAANGVISQIEQAMQEELSETHRQLFRNGSDKHRSWPAAFELFFAEEVKEKQRVFNILALDRLNELVAFAEEHVGELGAMNALVDQFRQEMHGRFDRLEAMIAQQAGVPLATMRVIAAGFGDELQPGADASAIETYLRQKASEYRELKERLVAIDAYDNYTRVLLQRAQESIDQGHFEEADAQLAEAEENDAQVGRDLRLAADQRDKDRSTKRALRGDAAKLRGDFAAAVAHYDAAGDLLPRSAVFELVARRWSAANAMREWGEQSDDPDLLLNAVARWGALAKIFDRTANPEFWAKVHNSLGVALARLGERQADTVGLGSAVTAFRSALEVYSRERFPLDWAATQTNLANVLSTLGERDEKSTLSEDAIAAHRAALEVYTRERAPLDWARTQSNLGVVLQSLGERNGSTALLEEAVAAHRASLEIRTEKRYPFQWAETQTNLGNSLSLLGQWKEDDAALIEALAAYRAALEVHTRHRLPVKWAGTQSNLGNTLLLLAGRKAETAIFDEAVAAYDAALEVRTRDRLPLDWAATTLSRILAIAIGLAHRADHSQIGKLRAEAQSARQSLVDAGHVPWSKWGDYVIATIDSLGETSD